MTKAPPAKSSETPATSFSTQEVRSVLGIKKQTPNAPAPKYSLASQGSTNLNEIPVYHSISESQESREQADSNSSVLQDSVNSSILNDSSQNMEQDSSLSNRFKAVISEITNRYFIVFWLKT